MQQEYWSGNSLPEIANSWTPIFFPGWAVTTFTNSFGYQLSRGKKKLHTTPTKLLHLTIYYHAKMMIIPHLVIIIVTDHLFLPVNRQNNLSVST